MPRRDPSPTGERDLDRGTLGDHLDRLYRSAWALCGSREDAEDLVQETYARALSRPRLVRQEGDLAYLMGALRNIFLDGRRSAARRPPPEALLADEILADRRAVGDPDRALEASEVFAAIAALPAALRDVVVAVDVAGLSYREAAGALDIRVGTVMSRLYRARERIVRMVDAPDSAPVELRRSPVAEGGEPLSEVV